ncbi:MAG: alpha/beta fold hydrolase [Defluviicoccus sp.]|nr:alpha/beta fold hydrolase [Defluviicoccus sp.]MDE0383700.1 alpha/beta fold hydrolase [Defluviicoccus sp.]
MDDTPGAAFDDTEVEADGFRIRYREAGSGRPLVCLHGGGGLRLSRAHDILARDRRVIAFEAPGFGNSPLNERSRNMGELAATMNLAVAALGIERYDLMGTSFGGKLALSMALERREPVGAVVLISPAAIRINPTPDIGPHTLHRHPDSPEARRDPVPPDVHARQRALSARLLGPPRDAAFENRLATLDVPVLALFGTEDTITPPEGARLYRQVLPDCHLMLVYDAAHAIDADRPEALAEVVGDFLARHGKFLVRQESDLVHP